MLNWIALVVPATRCALESVIAWRSEPGKLSLSVLTRKVFRTASNAPMSAVPPLNGRGRPRWSVAGAPVLVPASMAGLPKISATVGVGPPLSASGPTFGSIKLVLPTRVELVNPPALPTLPIRLLPWSTKTPATSESPKPVLPAMIVFLSENRPLRTRTPPPVFDALLRTIVSLSRVTDPAEL